jgi:hypothetical protein
MTEFRLPQDPATNSRSQALAFPVDQIGVLTLQPPGLSIAGTTVAAHCWPMTGNLETTALVPYSGQTVRNQPSSTLERHRPQFHSPK